MKKTLKIIGGVFGAFFLLVLILLIIDISNDDTQIKDEPQTPEERIINEINEKLGERTNEDKKRVVKVEFGEFSKVTLNGDETFSNKDLKLNMLSDTADVFQIIFKNEEVNKVMVGIQTTFVDEYGKEYDQDGVRVVLNRETYDKIVWENFNVENYENVAESLYIHPAVSEAANN
ncbi:hypothetical protein [Bacillus sp. Marseille-P3661]|uniref:hypothetical protein n=1 Tax=Bacillus sp. Marseille-P3661 TaxID=1936234 RepID=UPI000C839A7A|nr:hypothetical protein [Bacillus sp. Marseille-P3661]